MAGAFLSDVVAKLDGARAKALSDEGTRKRLHDLGRVIPVPAERTSQWLVGFVATEVERWNKVIKAAATN